MPTARTRRAQAGQSRFAVRTGVSRQERAADPLPLMVYAKRADPLPWHIVKAQESLREATARKEVEQALKNASDKLKQDKFRTLERLQEVRRTAAQVRRLAWPIL